MLLLTMQGCFHSSSGGGGGTTNNAPTASSVTITDDNGDTAVVGDTLSGSYTYADAEDDAEGATTFRWLRDGIGISDATASSYTLVSEDISSQITFEVTPVAATGSATGSAATSSAMMVENNADPTGYYNNTGFANVEDGTGGPIMINDLQAMVSGNRIMMMSTANKLLYDGTITGISGNNFTADFTIYTDGENPINATGSGTISEESKIEGTLTGNGVGKGAFTLTYAQATEQQAADLGRIEERLWDGDLAVGPDYAFNINAQGLLTHRFAAGLNVPVFDGCEINGTVIPISGSSLYEVTATLVNCDNSDVDTSVTNIYTGFAVSRTNSVVDDTLVLGLSSGVYSPNGELTVE